MQRRCSGFQRWRAGIFWPVPHLSWSKSAPSFRYWNEGHPSTCSQNPDSLTQLKECYSTNASCRLPGSEFSGGVRLSAKFQQQGTSSPSFQLGVWDLPYVHIGWSPLALSLLAKSGLVSRPPFPQPSPHLSWNPALRASRRIEGLRWRAAFGPFWGFQLSVCYYPASSPHPDTLRSNLARLLGDILAACPFDCPFDSAELQESWLCSVCTARHNRPQRAALEKHVRDWLPGFGLQVPLYCQSSPQQCSSSWPPMSRCMGSGSMGFPLAPACPGLAGELLNLAAPAGSAACDVLSHLLPLLMLFLPPELQRSCPVPQHRALFSLLPSAPSQLQDSLWGLSEVAHWQMALVAKWLPDHHTPQTCGGWKGKHDKTAASKRSPRSISLTYHLCGPWFQAYFGTGKIPFATGKKRKKKNQFLCLKM